MTFSSLFPSTLKSAFSIRLLEEQDHYNYWDPKVNVFEVIEIDKNIDHDLIHKEKRRNSKVEMFLCAYKLCTKPGLVSIQTSHLSNQPTSCGALGHILSIFFIYKIAIHLLTLIKFKPHQLPSITQKPKTKTKTNPSLFFHPSVKFVELMVFFLERIITSSKQNNHHHHLPSKKMCLALNTFESEISKSLFQLTSNSEILTIPWIQKCLNLLPKINIAFAKLVSDIDYPMTIWETSSIDEYLNYSLNSMELLNSITYSISQLTQARITVSHGLSLIETSQQPFEGDRLKVIEFENSNKKERQGEVIRSNTSSRKEWIIHQALLVKQQVWNWVCRVVESSIQGNLISEVDGFSDSSSSVNSNLRACEEIIMERKGMLMEVAQVNDGVVQILATAGTGNEVKELRRRLEVLERLMESVEEDVSNLFSEVLLNRNELLDIFQQKKHM